MEANRALLPNSLFGLKDIVRVLCEENHIASIRDKWHWSRHLTAGLKADPVITGSCHADSHSCPQADAS
jgi:hypothetical protein